jgi:hypothetical protein
MTLLFTENQLSPMKFWLDPVIYVYLQLRYRHSWYWYWLNYQLNNEILL